MYQNSMRTWRLEKLLKLEVDWGWFRDNMGPLIEQAIQEVNEEFRLAREQGSAGDGEIR